MHPDYLAHRDRQWRGGLPELFAALDRESAAASSKPFYVLPSGAFVRMERLVDGRRQLSIARSEAPKSIMGPQKWDAEISTFAKYFDIPLWKREAKPDPKGVCCLLTEPAGARCTRCGEPRDHVAVSALSETCTACAEKAKRGGSNLVPCGGGGCTNMVVREHAYSADGQRCARCAIEEGNRYTAERRREREQRASIIPQGIPQ